MRLGDGFAGWPEQAPFDRVIATAAPPEVPAELLKQLAVGGILVSPVGPSDGVQVLVLVAKGSTASRRGSRRRSLRPDGAAT